MGRLRIGTGLILAIVFMLIAVVMINGGNVVAFAEWLFS